jgi:arylsulfatase
MPNTPLNRRDFLKLLGLASLSGLGGGSVWNNKDIDNPDKLPNILIVVFDALSAKHVTLHGYHRETTPNLARIAERSTVFHNHYAGGNFTTPGTASLLTGTYPWSHRGLHIYGTVAREYVDRNIFSLLKDSYFTAAYSHNPLATLLLRQFGQHIDYLPRMETLTLTANTYSEIFFPDDFSAAYWGEFILRGFNKPLPSSLFLSLLDRFSFLKRVEDVEAQYADQFPRGLPNNLDDLFFTLETAIDWIQTQVSIMPQPFLGYFHLWPPHSPYNPRREFIGLFDDGWTATPKPTHHFDDGSDHETLNKLWRNYDEYIAYLDSEFGRLYDYMEVNGINQNTYLIFTTDHGEMFERGIYGHTTPTLYEPIIKIPLMISRPGGKTRQDITTPTNNVDLLPTLLQLAGKPVPDWVEGQILPTFDGSNEPQERGLFAIDAKQNAKRGPITRGTIALVKYPYKLIHYSGYNDFETEYELYDLSQDPEELVDRYPTNPSIAADLRDELHDQLDRSNQDM